MPAYRFSVQGIVGEEGGRQASEGGSVREHGAKGTAGGIGEKPSMALL